MRTGSRRGAAGYGAGFSSLLVPSSWAVGYSLCLLGASSSWAGFGFSHFLPPTSISSLPVSALPHASNLCTWTAFLNSSAWVLAEWKPDGPAVPTVISPPALASLPFSLLSWHGRNICLYLGGLRLTAVPLSLCCNMSWKLFIPLLLRLVEVSARWIQLLRKQLTFQD